MGDLLFSIVGLYAIIAIGYAWKKYMAPELEPRNLSLLMLYFLAPGLVFWGFSAAPLSLNVLHTALWYTVIVLLALLVGQILSYVLDLGPKRKAILVMNHTLLNTGNLGIPIGLAFLGPESLPYTTAINLVSIILSYTIGVYFYSRGQCTPLKALHNIIKLPVLWLAGIAVGLNLTGLDFNQSVLNFLELIGHTAIGVQLLILGVFLAAYMGRIKAPKFFYATLLGKYLILPTLAVSIVTLFSLKGLLAQTLILQSLMPAAVNNLNLASLYHCRPEEVTPIVFWSSILGALIIPFGLWWLL